MLMRYSIGGSPRRPEGRGRRTEGRGQWTRSGVRTGGAARGPAEPAGRRDGEARGAAHRREEKNDGAEGRGGARGRAARRAEPGRRRIARMAAPRRTAAVNDPRLNTHIVAGRGFARD